MNSAAAAPAPRLFDFGHLYNVRDLGGYPTADGRRTRWRKYIRGSAEGFLTEAEKERLYEDGVRLIVDLRHDSELTRTRSPLAGYRDIAYYQGASRMFGNGLLAWRPWHEHVARSE